MTVWKPDNTWSVRRVSDNTWYIRRVSGNTWFVRRVSGCAGFSATCYQITVNIPPAADKTASKQHASWLLGKQPTSYFLTVCVCVQILGNEPEHLVHFQESQ